MSEDIRELLSCFEPITRFSGRLERGTVDFGRPKTELAKFSSDLHARVEALDGERVGELVVGLIRQLPTFEPNKAFAAQPMPRGRRVRLLCDYLDGIDREHPMVVSAIYGGSFLPTLDCCEVWMTAQVLLRAAANARGEERSQKLRSLSEYLEVVYRELITIIYELECVRAGCEVSRGLDFGNLVETVAGWTSSSLPGFVDRDAARIRNAAAHYHWNYEPATRTLRLHNRNKRGNVTWKRDFSMTELYRRVRDMFFDASYLHVALVWSTSNAFFEMFRHPPLSRIFERGLLASPPPELEEMNRRAIAAYLRPMRERLATSAWSSRSAEREAASQASAAPKS